MIRHHELHTPDTWTFLLEEDTARDDQDQDRTAIEEANPRVMEVKGRNILTGLPKTIKLTSEESVWHLKMPQIRS